MRRFFRFRASIWVTSHGAQLSFVLIVDGGDIYVMSQRMPEQSRLLGHLRLWIGIGFRMDAGQVLDQIGTASGGVGALVASEGALARVGVQMGFEMLQLSETLPALAANMRTLPGVGVEVRLEMA